MEQGWSKDDGIVRARLSIAYCNVQWDVWAT